MFFVNSFLKSSTINGLVHISTTRRFARLFWILVVITGFVLSGIIIQKSFDSWSETPVKTVIETLTITDMKFPKVTICPPQKTYTDLNYDLMMTKNMTLTKEMRDELFKYAVEFINEDSFILNNWTKIHEKERAYNWYHGYTEMRSPIYYQHNSQNNDICTSATSGVVTTQYYGERLTKLDLIERKLYYSVYIYPPKIENAKINLIVEKVTMPGLSEGSEDQLAINRNLLEVYQTNMLTNFTVSCSKYNDDVDNDDEHYDDLNRTCLSYLFEDDAFQFEYIDITYVRDISTTDVEHTKLDVMPGFTIIWWYNDPEVTPDNKYTDFEINKQFVL